MAATFRMRLRVITAVSSLALLAGPALAQTAPPSSLGGAGPMRPPSAAPERPRAPMPNPLTMEDVSQIKGTAVYDSGGKKIGSISTVLMQPSSKTIDRLVVGEGGVLGVGSHHVALPVDAFAWDSQKDGFTLTKTADDLKSMPEWQQQQLTQAPAGAKESHE
jgi:sporulation protein YlmC with PRC-barrel domain